MLLVIRDIMTYRHRTQALRVGDVGTIKKNMQK